MQGPFSTAAALLKAFSSGDLKFCSSPGWGKPSFDFLPFTTIPFTPHTVSCTSPQVIVWQHC